MRRTYRRDELRRGLAPQTQPMLTRQLRELDADGVS
ncbi:winged helix-turn-helix transcriptional regulator [Actinoalloteichus hymeniacidonis]|nr:winged helix-turn-helix transcriptional regulator [Actinoalloteichus hymeniacidonis]MBB5908311.1 DNA-binding HxlR family transcriptional regulator [Actinoalloteichus hymeniacidonis]